MMLIAGTVPVEGLPLTLGAVKAEGESLVVNGYHLPSSQGTGAMIDAALAVTSYLNLETPQVLVCGDRGQGTGSREIYEYLIQKVAELSPEVLALHYWLPNMALTRRLCQAINKCARRPMTSERRQRSAKCSSRVTPTGSRFPMLRCIAL